MASTESRPAATLPPVALTPEEAAAIAVALAAQPEGPYAEAGRGALEKVLDALEPDPRRRALLLATSLWARAPCARPGSGAGQRGRPAPGGCARRTGGGRPAGASWCSATATARAPPP